VNAAPAIRNRYRKRTAAVYEKRRSWEQKWKNEQAAMNFFLGKIGGERSVLDLPVGTGRFLDLYTIHGFLSIGMDVSPDMLAQARLKDQAADLRIGDALDIALADSSVDVAVCVRFLNWLTLEQMRRVMAELGRVACNFVIVSVRLSERANVKAGGKARIHSTAEFAEALRNARLETADVRLLHRARRGNYFMLLLRRCHETH